MTPVSYTHLDVYKRQLVTMTKENNGERGLNQEEMHAISDTQEGF